jgi:hypothetical protein
MAARTGRFPEFPFSSTTANLSHSDGQIIPWLIHFRYAVNDKHLICPFRAVAVHCPSLDVWDREHMSPWLSLPCRKCGPRSQHVQRITRKDLQLDPASSVHPRQCNELTPRNGARYSLPLGYATIVANSNPASTIVARRVSNRSLASSVVRQVSSLNPFQ